MNEGNIKAIGFVNLCRIPLAETVSADPLIPEIIAYHLQLLLDCPFRNGEDALIGAYAVPQGKGKIGGFLRIWHTVLCL